MVKVQRSDLKRSGLLPLLIPLELMLAIVSSYFIILVLLATLSPILLAAVAGLWIAVAVLVSSIVVALVLSLVQFHILVRTDFRLIRRINRIGRIVTRIFIAILSSFLAYVLVVSLGNIYHAWPAITIEEPVITPFLFAYVLFLVGSSLEDYTAVFLPDRLAMLYFRQAKELNDPLEKLAMTREGVKWTEKKVHEYGLELDASRFERMLAIRLLDHQNIDRELECLSSCFSENSSLLTVLNEVGLGGESSLVPRRSYRESVGDSLVGVLKYAALLSVLIASINLVMKILELQGLIGP